MSFKTCLTHCLEHFAPVSTFQIDDIKSVYTRCTDPLIKQHDGDTHVRHRLVLVSTEQEGFLCGLETYEYKLKNRHIVYISKVDTTQTFEKFKGLTARIVQSYIASLPPLSSVFVFARAQPQYLFARSAENKQKKALNDRDLVYWWLSVLNKVPVESEGWWSVPGIDDQTSALIEIGAKRRGWRSSDKVQWHYGTSYPPEAEADQVIPRFEDDAKSRLLRNTDKMTVVDFWNLLSIGEECGSGKVTGFFELRLKSQTQTETEAVACTSSDFTLFWNKLMSLDFHDAVSNKASTETAREAIKDTASFVIQTKPSTLPTVQPITTDKRPAIHMLSNGFIKRKKK